MAFTISTQPVSLTAVPGQDSTFSVVASTNLVPASAASFAYQWYLSGGTVTAIAGATTSSYTIDPLITDSGKSFFVTVSGNDVTPMLSSTRVSLTVIEDVPPYDVYDVGSETGRQRYLRLHLLGYV